MGIQDGVDDLVMKLAEGKTLLDRLQGGPVPFKKLLPIATAMAGALDEARALREAGPVRITEEAKTTARR